MKYRHTDYDFKLEVLPISGGTFSSFVRRYPNLYVAKLFEEYIAPALYNTPKVFSAREPFTLVNVTCTHSGFSFGTMPQPPKDVMPLACTWFFTFALSDETYDDKVVPKYSSLRWINTRVWGASKSKFVTIGIPHIASQELGLAYDMYTPQAAYYFVGALSKSFVRNHRYWNNPEPADYERNYHGFMPSLAHSSFYMTPLANLLMRTPYHLFVFNRHIWMSASSLLSDKHITPNSLLYVLMYIRRIDSLPKFVEDKILDLLQSSLLSTIQRVENKTVAQDLGDCLYTALVFKDEIPEANTFQWLKDKEQSVMDFGLDHVSDYRDYLRGLFYS